MREHLAVIDAIERRDQDGAVAALTRHINNARSRAMRIAPAQRQPTGGERMSITRRKFAAGSGRGRGRRRHHAPGARPDRDPLGRDAADARIRRCR